MCSIYIYLFLTFPLCLFLFLSDSLNLFLSVSICLCLCLSLIVCLSCLSLGLSVLSHFLPVLSFSPCLTSLSFAIPLSPCLLFHTLLSLFLLLSLPHFSLSFTVSKHLLKSKGYLTVRSMNHDGDVPSSILRTRRNFVVCYHRTILHCNMVTSKVARSLSLLCKYILRVMINTPNRHA